MLEQIEGSQAVARAVACCRPEVVCAYPISPQTHIIEAIGVLVRTGELAPCEFLNVESEFAALSVAQGLVIGCPTPDCALSLRVNPFVTRMAAKRGRWWSR